MRTPCIRGTLPASPNFRSIPPLAPISFPPPPHPSHPCPFGAEKVGWHGWNGAWLRHARAECALGSGWPGVARRGGLAQHVDFRWLQAVSALIPAPLDSSLQGLSIGTQASTSRGQMAAPASDQYKGVFSSLPSLPPPLLSPFSSLFPFLSSFSSPSPLLPSHKRAQACHNEPQQTRQLCMPHTSTRWMTAEDGRCGRARVDIVSWPQQGCCNDSELSLCTCSTRGSTCTGVVSCKISASAQLGGAMCTKGCEGLKRGDQTFAVP